MLKTIVVLHRILRDGSQPLIESVLKNNTNLAQVMAMDRPLPQHWTDATIISTYSKYLALRLDSTFLQGQKEVARDSAESSHSVSHENTILLRRVSQVTAASLASMPPWAGSDI